MSAPALASYSNGISQVSGDNLNTLIQWCVTANQLRGFAPNPAVPNMQVFMQGYNSAGDGGQGNFYWNTVTGTDDGGVTTIVPNGSTAGCWTRMGNSSLLYTPQTISNSGNVALTAANVTNQVLLFTGGSTPTNTFPTAAAIIGAMSGAQAGSIRDLLIISENSGTTTVTPGAGVTFSGNLSTGNFAISATSQRIFKIYVASASAVTVYG